MVRWFCILMVLAYAKIFFRHKVYGREKLPSGVGGIIASNHCSFLDPPLIGVSCPGEKIDFLARGSLFNWGPFAWLLKQLHTHPVVKGKGNAAIFKMSCDLVISGKKIVIFPEGSRSYDGQIRPGQLGVGMLVMKTRAPVFPAYTHGTFEIWNAHQKLMKPFGKTAVVFGDPIYFDFDALEAMPKKEAQELITQKTMDAIAKLRDWYLSNDRKS